jgi:hypothetical protein
MASARARFSALARQADPCSQQPSALIIESLAGGHLRQRRNYIGSQAAYARTCVHSPPQPLSLALLSSYAAPGTDRPCLVVSSFRVASVISGLCCFVSLSLVLRLKLLNTTKPPCPDAGSAAAGSWAAARALARPLRLCLDHPVRLPRPRAPLLSPRLRYRRLLVGVWPT